MVMELAYKILVRPQVEHASSVWTPPPYKGKHLKNRNDTETS